MKKNPNAAMTVAEAGRKGGKAGKGKAKARDPKLMSQAGKKGAKVRWSKKKKS